MLPVTRKTALSLLLILTCLAITACPNSQSTGSTPPDEPEPAVEHIPLFETPGLHLIYTVNDPRSTTFNASTSAHVLIAEPDGSRREVLFTFPGFIFHTVPSPTGTKIAFVAVVPAPDGSEERHVFIYDIDGQSYIDVSAPGFYSRDVQTAPIFTPDGQYVIFISKRSSESGIFNIFRCDVESGRAGGLYTDPVEDTPLGMMPDGIHCIAVRRVQNTPSSLEYISIDVNTGASESLFRFSNVTKVGPAHPAPDGSRIYCDIKPSEENPSNPFAMPSRQVLSVDLSSGDRSVLLNPNSVTYLYQVFVAEDGSEKLLLRRQESIEGEETPMSRIAVSNTDGSEFTYLTDTSSRCYLLDPPSNIPPVSPDFSLIFFYRKDPLWKHEDIWVMNIDGTDPVNISNTAGYVEGSAGWIIIPEA
jgi:hypothetical protein